VCLLQNAGRPRLFEKVTASLPIPRAKGVCLPHVHTRGPSTGDGTETRGRLDKPALPPGNRCAAHSSGLLSPERVVMERTSYVRALLDDKMGVNRDGDMAQYEIKVSRPVPPARFLGSIPRPVVCQQSRSILAGRKHLQVSVRNHSWPPGVARGSSADLRGLAGVQAVPPRAVRARSVLQHDARPRRVLEGGLWRGRQQVQEAVRSACGPPLPGAMPPSWLCGFAHNWHHDVARPARRYLGDRGSAPDRSAYVMEQRAMLEQFLRDVDRGIQRNQRRVETAQGYRPEAVDLESRPEVLELTAQIDKAMADSEAAGEEGRVDEAEALLADAERLRGSKLSLQRRLLAEVGGGSRGGLVGNSHLLQVCNACGAMLSERDSDDRLREHFEGRMHLGVVRVRERMAELRGERRPALPARAGPQTASASRGPAAPAAAADRGPPPATLGRGPAEPAATA